MQKPEDNKQEPLSTEYLENILKQSRSRELGKFLKQNEKEMLDDERPFTAYMRQVLKKNKVSQHDMFMTAGITAVRILISQRYIPRALKCSLWIIPTRYSVITVK